MDNQFDEFSKSLAESVSRREALKKFGHGLASALLLSVGLSARASRATCLPEGSRCTSNSQCCTGRCFAINSPYIKYHVCR
jgi:hypothetical protein